MRGPHSALAEARRYLFSGGRWWKHLLELGLLIAALVGVRLLSIYVWKLPNGDVVEYYRYALAFWTRNPPFHALPLEYPPLAILPFSLTQLPPLSDYQAVYAYWMGALVIAGYSAFLRFSTRRRAIAFAIYLVIGAAATLLARFDLVPALVTLAALWLAQRRRFGYAYVLLGLGILLKLYPVFLLPVVAIEHWHVAAARARIAGSGAGSLAELRAIWRGGPSGGLRRLRAQPVVWPVTKGVAFCLGVVAFGFLGPLIIDPGGALSGFGYAGNRPLQIESTPATLLWLGTIFGIPAHPNYSFVSLNYVGSLDVALKPLSALALVAGCCVVYWRQAKGRLTLGQAFVACLSVVIVTNKLFSPQYLIWVLPIVAAVDGFDFIWLVICLLTTLEFPIIYQMRHPIWTVPYSWQFMPVLAIRNGLLTYATIRAIVRPRRTVPVSQPAPVVVAETAEADASDGACTGAAPALIG
ncbi:MAG: DUF2029 domain-containing protein [Ktedonobacterales bacterium]|nr:DUF2029 domain-containing protein [Ktedonobacterales bacterium]